MVKNQQSEEKEEKASKEEAQRLLDLAKEDEKRIKEEIRALKAEIENAQQVKTGRVIDVHWAQEQIAEYSFLAEVAGRKKDRLEKIVTLGIQDGLPELINFTPKQKVYFDKKSNEEALDEEKPKDDKQEKREPVEEKKPEKEEKKKKTEKKLKKNKKIAGEEQKKTGNAKLKEIARGVSAFALEKQAREINSSVKGLDNAAKNPSQKEQLKKEKEQEKVFKKLQKENDKGITATRTEGLFVNKDGKKEDKTTIQKTAGDDKKKMDELRHTELKKKIENLREKLEKLQEKRLQQAKGLGREVDEVKFNAQEAKKLPSVKAGEAVKKALEAKELPKAEIGGVISESSLNKVEYATKKAEESVKTASFVPDYATPEFKKKAEEQKRNKNADRQKLLALSGRSVADNRAENSQENEKTQEKQEYRIDPEKSKQRDAEKNGKEISLQQYQEMKRLKSNSMAG